MGAFALGLWLLAASLLWRTSVPQDLKLPHLDPERFFSQAETHRAAHFSSVLVWLIVAATLVQVAVLAAVAVVAKRVAAAFSVGRIGKGVLVGCFAGTMLWLAGMPFDLALTWWERRYGLVLDDYWTWAIGSWATLGFDILFTTLLIVLLMALAGAFPRTWWLPASGIVIAYVALFTFIGPWLVFDTHPVRDPALKASIERMERREGVTGTKVEVEKVSDTTSLVNAYTIGFGPSQRVVLWDTLIDKYTPRQVVVVAAHELGHVRSRHILKGMGWSVLIIVPELFLVALATRRRGGMAQPAAVPIALLVLTVLAIGISPAFNEVSRRYEAEADWRALNASRDPQAAVGAFHRFTTDDLSEPSPPTWDYIFFEDHPTVIQRIAMVQAWQARKQSGG